MRNNASGAKLTSFRNKYLALIAVSLLLLSFPALSQVRQPVNAFGFDWLNGRFKRSLVVPSDTPHLSPTDTPAVAIIGPTQYKWDGTRWNTLAGGSGGMLYNGIANGGVTVNGSNILLDTISKAATKFDLLNLRRYIDTPTAVSLFRDDFSLKGSIADSSNPLRVKNPYIVTQSSAELRSIPLPDANTVYRRSVNGKVVEYFYKPGDFTSTDDSITIVRVPAPYGGGVMEMVLGDAVDPALFGVLPDDNVDDTYAMQRCFNYAVNNTKTHLIRFSRVGVYLIHDLLLAKFVAGQAQQVTFTIEAPHPSKGLGVYFRNTDPQSATLHIQTAQNSVIRNIVFEGAGPEIVSWATANDSYFNAGGTVRDNPFSPHVIADIDGLYSSVTGSNRYPGMLSYYSNSVFSGTTNLLFENCSGSNFIAAVAEGLSGCPNGENIVWRGGFGKSMKHFWIAGQLQSRDNVIDGVYFYAGKSFVTNVGYGTGIGDVPHVKNFNINYVQQFYQTYGQHTSVRFSDGYAEGIRWIGSSGDGSQPTVFTNVSITLFENNSYTPYLGAPVTLTEGVNSFIFNGGMLESQNQLQGFPFNNQQVAFNGTNIRGGVPFMVLPNNFDRIRFNGVQFQNATQPLQLEESMVLNNGANESSMNGRYFLPTNAFVSNTGRKYENIGSKIDRIPVGSYAVTFSNATKTSTFTAPQPGLFQVGDVITVDEHINDPDDIFSSGQTSIGYVSGISGTTFTLAYCPAGMSNTSYTMYVARIPKFIQNTVADVEAGSDTLRNVLQEDATFPVGSVIKGKGIPAGARVLYVGGGKIKISVPATATAAQVYVYDAEIRTSATNRPFNYFGSTVNIEQIGAVWPTGSRIDYTESGSTIQGKVVTVAGKVGITGKEPTFLSVGGGGSGGIAEEVDPDFAAAEPVLAKTNASNTFAGAQTINPGSGTQLIIDNDGGTLRQFSPNQFTYQSNWPC